MNLQELQQQLQQALALINTDYASKTNIRLEDAHGLSNTQSLLQRCEQVARQNSEKSKPVLRIIRHLACSGGTLISKCISALPNVYLLSEVHPFVNLGLGIGTDISSLTKFAGIPMQRELAARLFVNSIHEVYEHVINIGGTLVLREHTHIDFSTEQNIPTKSTLIELLEEYYEIRSILTIRDPIDSYASLVKKGWVHFSPKTFEEYCRRIVILISQCQDEQIFKYEEFVKNPQLQMQEMVKSLGLTFHDNFEHIFSIFKVTGDSGRSGDVIESRPRVVPEGIINESQISASYKEFLKFGFY
ncbi:MAG TPA: hypothetical protein VIM85_03315 [Pseudomonadales bacterium]